MLKSAVPIAILALVALSAPASGRPRVADQTAAAFEAAFSAAVQANDPAAVARMTAPDWKIISGDGRLISRAQFRQVIAGGRLTHDEVAAHGPQTVRILGITALVTSRVQSSGAHDGVTFKTAEIGTDVIVKAAGRWTCVLTQLTTVAKS